MRFQGVFLSSLTFTPACPVVVLQATLKLPTVLLPYFFAALSNMPKKKNRAHAPEFQSIISRVLLHHAPATRIFLGPCPWAVLEKGTFDFGRLLLQSHGRHLTAIWVCGLGRPKGIVCSRRPTPSNRIPPKFPSILGPILMHGAG